MLDVRTMMALFAALIVLLGIAIFLLSIILTDSQRTRPHTPSVKTEQQADGALKGQGNPGDQTESSPDAAVGQHQPSAASEAKSHDQPKEATHETSEFWTIGGRSLKITDTLLVVFTFCLFLATVALFWATRDLVEDAKHSGEVNSRNMQAAIAESRRSADAAKAAADVARDSIKLAEATAERQLRAYVFVKPDKVPSLSQWHTLGARIIVINSGQTPAYKLRYWIAVDLREYPLTSELTEITGDMLRSIIQTRTVLNPGLTQELPIVTANELSPENRAAIIAGSQALIVWGRVDYTDAFGIERFSKFRLEYMKESVTNSALAWAPEGNDAN